MCLNIQTTLRDKRSPQGFDQMQIKNPAADLSFKKKEKKTAEPVFSHFMINVILVDGK